MKELCVVSQDTSAYGVDIRCRTGFWQGRPVRTRMTELARELDALAHAHCAWVRLHYVYPYPHVDEVIAMMRHDVSAGGLVPYLDVPFQHASPRILELMKRPAAPERVLERVRAWRKALPGLTLRSTFIVGFPGETQAEFEELLAFLEDAQLDRVGCFAYSPVEGAAANALSDPVDPDVQEARRRAVHGGPGADQRRASRAQGRHDADGTHRWSRRAPARAEATHGRRRSKRRRCAGDRRRGLRRRRRVAPARSFARVDIVSAEEHDLHGRVSV